MQQVKILQVSHYRLTILLRYHFSLWTSAVPKFCLCGHKDETREVNTLAEENMEETDFCNDVTEKPHLHNCAD